MVDSSRLLADSTEILVEALNVTVCTAASSSIDLLLLHKGGSSSHAS